MHTYLGSIHTDDAVAIACAVVKVGDGDGLLAGRDPVLLCGWVDLEDMGPGGVDRLLPGGQREEERDLNEGSMTADRTHNVTIRRGALSRGSRAAESQQAGDNVTQTLHLSSRLKPVAHQHPPLSEATVTHA